MKTLLVDNHDSYTYNVFHLLAAASGEEPMVVNNDAVSWRVLTRMDFDAIVLSPGPGHPSRWHDFGVCRDILAKSEVPVFGICLGHQGIGNLLEGTVNRAPMAMHGRLSRVMHEGKGLFKDVPQGFSVVRYHSLAITSPPGPDGSIVAWSDDGVVMGVEHTKRPIWGVQFHPESISTEYGLKIAENFFELAASYTRPGEKPAGRATIVPQASKRAPRAAAQEGAGELELRMRTIAGQAPTEHVYERLFAEHDPSFWLDSADAPTWLAQCSYMGTTAGPDRCFVSYDVDSGEVAVNRGGVETVEHKSIFDYLQRELGRIAVDPPEGVERGLVGGYVGYLGYELKADCGSPSVHSSDLPDAALMLANRVVAVDHTKDVTYVFALCRGEDPEAELWLDAAEELIARAIAEPPAERPLAPPSEPGGHVSFHSGRGRSRYLADIVKSQAELLAGESYEVCLTDQFSTDASPEPFELYRQLRRANPSPFSAFLHFGENAIVSSSPERFISVDRQRQVMARPIKGTISRVEDPAEDAARVKELGEDEKTYAEHLMIVDLLRNDLGVVCDVDSVQVPDLMVIEPYATVHQMVSTIVGRLEDGRSAVDCVRATFPGGSMTGAPKERTMEIIDDLEAEARGVYSGSIGYFGADGSTDLNIVIRTIVMRPGRTTIGAGGAIVMQSDPEEEFDEILLKARAPMAAIARTVTGSDAPGEAWSVELEPVARQAEAA
ncbi:MAG TPA: aminodeoxychorismate synthase component I [Solirubrobacterales bacterium]|nr:aminodeoxychorismate synthase component I [Solirubrobacterales bacterium]